MVVGATVVGGSVVVVDVGGAVVVVDVVAGVGVVVDVTVVDGGVVVGAAIDVVVVSGAAAASSGAVVVVVSGAPAWPVDSAPVGCVLVVDGASFSYAATVVLVGGGASVDGPMALDANRNSTGTANAPRIQANRRDRRSLRFGAVAIGSGLSVVSWYLHQISTRTANSHRIND